jgi:hypothetical protein
VRLLGDHLANNVRQLQDELRQLRESIATITTTATSTRVLSPSPPNTNQFLPLFTMPSDSIATISSFSFSTTISPVASTMDMVVSPLPSPSPLLSLPSPHQQPNQSTNIIATPTQTMVSTWSCDTCTLVNEATAKSCVACDRPSPSVIATQSVSVTSPIVLPSTRLISNTAPPVVVPGSVVAVAQDQRLIDAGALLMHPTMDCSTTSVTSSVVVPIVKAIQTSNPSKQSSIKSTNSPKPKVSVKSQPKSSSSSSGVVAKKAVPVTHTTTTNPVRTPVTTTASTEKKLVASKKPPTTSSSEKAVPTRTTTTSSSTNLVRKPATATTTMTTEKKVASKKPSTTIRPPPHQGKKTDFQESDDDSDDQEPPNTRSASSSSSAAAAAAAAAAALAAGVGILAAALFKPSTSSSTSSRSLGPNAFASHTNGPVGPVSHSGSGSSQGVPYQPTSSGIPYAPSFSYPSSSSSYAPTHGNTHYSNPY